MAEQFSDVLPPIDAWLAWTLRITAFPSARADLQDQNWWERVVGQAPESQTVQPRQAGRRDEGGYEGRKLVLETQLARVDWHLVPPEEVAELGDFPNVGTYPEAVPLLIDAMHRWIALKDFPAITRLAFGAVLLRPVSSQVDGYRELARYLPRVEIDAEASSDFLYQINRRRPSRSGIPDLPINRLSKWSVSAMSLVPLNAPPNTPTIAKHACRLELDVNTGREFERELPHDHMHDVLQELVANADEIGAKGDIR